MFEAIIGKNSSGKTVVLKRQLRELIEDGEVIATNLVDSDLLCDIEISSRSLELLNNIVELDTFKVLDNNIVYDEQLENHSKDFLELVNVVCRDADAILVDEPETGLTERESYFVGLLLNQISKERNVYITTHKEDFYWFDECITYVTERKGDAFEKVRYEV